MPFRSEVQQERLNEILIRRERKDEVLPHLFIFSPSFINLNALTRSPQSLTIALYISDNRYNYHGENNDIK